MPFILRNTNKAGVKQHRRSNYLLLDASSSNNDLGGNYIASSFGLTPDIKYSVDGMVWNTVATGFRIGPMIQITKTKFYGFGNVGNPAFLRFVETNNGGQNWTNNGFTNIASSGTIIPTMIATNNSGLYVATVTNSPAGAGQIYSSTDFINWTLRYSSANSNNFNAVRYLNGQFFALMGNNPSLLGGTGGPIVYSSDGINWTQTNNVILSDNSVNANYFDINFINGNYIVCGIGTVNINTNANIAISSGSNLDLWTPSGLFDSANIYRWFAKSASRLAVCRQNIRIAYTDDGGANFAIATGSFPNTGLRVIYKGGLFVAVDGGGREGYSITGDNFTISGANLGNGWSYLV